MRYGLSLLDSEFSNAVKRS